jgi:hypothetical protein
LKPNFSISWTTYSTTTRNFLPLTNLYPERLEFSFHLTAHPPQHTYRDYNWQTTMYNNPKVCEKRKLWPIHDTSENHRIPDQTRIKKYCGWYNWNHLFTERHVSFTLHNLSWKSDNFTYHTVTSDRVHKADGNFPPTLPTIIFVRLWNYVPPLFATISLFYSASRINNTNTPNKKEGL